MSKLPKPLESTGHCEKVCAECPSSFECGVLTMAIVVLEAAAQDSEDWSDLTCLRMLKQRMDLGGFCFPEGETRCWFSENRPAIRATTVDAITAINQSAFKKKGA